VNMCRNAATQANMDILRQRGHHILEPSTGLLACGYEGQGKYPPNEEIIYALRCYLEYRADLAGKKVLVTAGATAEPIDPMRMISNRSSGKMGLAIARAFALRGADVTLIHGMLSETVPYYLRKAVYTPTVQEMYEQVLAEAAGMDLIVKCAAVSDYKPASASSSKIKKGKALSLDLVTTPDILAQLGKLKPKGQLLVGFAAETENLIENARSKLVRKNLDLICVNHLSTAGADSTELTLVTPSKAAHPRYRRLSGDKFDVALQLAERINKLWNAN